MCTMVVVVELACRSACQEVLVVHLMISSGRVNGAVHIEIIKDALSMVIANVFDAENMN